jgi:3D (Asp-Asp-Asp) domain-containing protein
MPLQATSGAASYDAFGGGVPVVPTYIEEVFSTYLYTGNGNSSQLTITNNIDLSTKGGLVWVKDRTSANDHALVDTVRGAYNTLKSNTTDASASLSTITGFNTTGFNLGGSVIANANGDTYVSWTLRKQPKFFDIVTFSGNGSNRTISHNLGSTPGCIFVKCTSQDTGGWQVYHRGMTSAAYSMNLNGTSAQSSQPTVWNSTAPTSTVFSVGTAATVNQSGDTYVAYLFAHDAGGFGLTGTDNVISCGSFTANGSGTASVNLSYEPQWVMFKRSDSATFGDWAIFDNMRGLPSVGSGDTAAKLFPNTSAAENAASGDIKITSTGFNVDLVPSAAYIYIAIRRGPMKVPTSGTSVFKPMTRTGTAAAATVTGAGFTPDSVLIKDTSSGGRPFVLNDRLRGVNNYLLTSSTSDEATVYSTWFGVDNSIVLGMDGYSIVNSAQIINASPAPLINYFFRRAPSFFDEVCYTGTGSARTVTHNLQAVPQLMLVKQRTASPAGSPFTVYSATLGNTGVLFLNSDGGNQGPDSQWNSTTPTSSVFSLGSSLEVNQSGSTYVAYLFSTCAGVSKVGSYTGTGTTLQVDCGFTSGARFVLIKRSGTGDWYVWDSARGIVSGNDPYLLLNTTAAEVTNTDYIDTYSAGFEISSTAPSAINASGGTFIFLAIA